MTKYAQTQNKNLYGLIDLGGKQVLPPKYEKIIVLNQGQAFIVEKQQHFGILNAKGKVVIPVVLDNILMKDKGRRQNTTGTAEFPILCQLRNTWFYVTASGRILPMTAEKLPTA